MGLWYQKYSLLNNEMYYLACKVSLTPLIGCTFQLTQFSLTSSYFFLHYSSKRPKSSWFFHYTISCTDTQMDSPFCPLQLCIKCLLTCVYFTFVFSSNVPNLSSSNTKSIICPFLNMPSSKSLRIQILSCKTPCDSTTYKLNRLNPLLGGLAMSMMSFSIVWPCAW